jgi:Protein of unknown function (DUF2442)
LYGPLRDLELFNQVRIDPEAETLVWPDGADFDPATLHEWDTNAQAFLTPRSIDAAAGNAGICKSKPDLSGTRPIPLQCSVSKFRSYFFSETFKACVHFPRSV